MVFLQKGIVQITKKRQCQQEGDVLFAQKGKSFGSLSPKEKMNIHIHSLDAPPASNKSESLKAGDCDSNKENFPWISTLPARIHKSLAEIFQNLSRGEMPSYTISNDYGYIYLDILKKKKL